MRGFLVIVLLHCSMVSIACPTEYAKLACSSGCCDCAYLNDELGAYEE